MILVPVDPAHVLRCYERFVDPKPFSNENMATLVPQPTAAGIDDGTRNFVASVGATATVAPAMPAGMVHIDNTSHRANTVLTPIPTRHSRRSRKRFCCCRVRGRPHREAVTPTPVYASNRAPPAPSMQLHMQQQQHQQPQQQQQQPQHHSLPGTRVATPVDADSSADASSAQTAPVVVKQSKAVQQMQCDSCLTWTLLPTLLLQMFFVVSAVIVAILLALVFSVRLAARDGSAGVWVWGFGALFGIIVEMLLTTPLLLSTVAFFAGCAAHIRMRLHGRRRREIVREMRERRRAVILLARERVLSQLRAMRARGRTRGTVTTTGNIGPNNTEEVLWKVRALDKPDARRSRSDSTSRTGRSAVDADGISVSTSVVAAAGRLPAPRGTRNTSGVGAGAGVGGVGKGLASSAQASAADPNTAAWGWAPLQLLQATARVAQAPPVLAPVPLLTFSGLDLDDLEGPLTPGLHAMQHMPPGGPRGSLKGRPAHGGTNGAYGPANVSNGDMNGNGNGDGNNNDYGRGPFNALPINNGYPNGGSSNDNGQYGPNATQNNNFNSNNNGTAAQKSVGNGSRRGSPGPRTEALGPGSGAMSSTHQQQQLQHQQLPRPMSRNSGTASVTTTANNGSGSYSSSGIMGDHTSPPPPPPPLTMFMDSSSGPPTEQQLQQYYAHYNALLAQYMQQHIAQQKQEQELQQQQKDSTTRLLEDLAPFMHDSHKDHVSLSGGLPSTNNLSCVSGALSGHVPGSGNSVLSAPGRLNSDGSAFTNLTGSYVRVYPQAVVQQHQSVSTPLPQQEQQEQQQLQQPQQQQEQPQQKQVPEQAQDKEQEQQQQLRLQLIEVLLRQQTDEGNGKASIGNGNGVNADGYAAPTDDQQLQQQLPQQPPPQITAPIAGMSAMFSQNPLSPRSRSRSRSAFNTSPLATLQETGQEEEAATATVATKSSDAPVHPPRQPQATAQAQSQPQTQVQSQFRSQGFVATVIDVSPHSAGGDDNGQHISYSPVNVHALQQQQKQRQCDAAYPAQHTVHIADSEREREAMQPHTDAEVRAALLAAEAATAQHKSEGYKAGHDAVRPPAASQ